MKIPKQKRPNVFERHRIIDEVKDHLNKLVTGLLVQIGGIEEFEAPHIKAEFTKRNKEWMAYCRSKNLNPVAYQQFLITYLECEKRMKELFKEKPEKLTIAK